MEQNHNPESPSGTKPQPRRPKWNKTTTQKAQGAQRHNPEDTSGTKPQPRRPKWNKTTSQKPQGAQRHNPEDTSGTKPQPRRPTWNKTTSQKPQGAQSHNPEGPRIIFIFRIKFEDWIYTYFGQLLFWPVSLRYTSACSPSFFPICFCLLRIEQFLFSELYLPLIPRIY